MVKNTFLLVVLVLLAFAALTENSRLDQIRAVASSEDRISYTSPVQQQGAPPSATQQLAQVQTRAQLAPQPKVQPVSQTNPSLPVGGGGVPQAQAAAQPQAQPVSQTNPSPLVAGGGIPQAQAAAQPQSQPSYQPQAQPAIQPVYQPLAQPIAQTQPQSYAAQQGAQQPATPEGNPNTYPGAGSTGAMGNMPGMGNAANLPGMNVGSNTGVAGTGAMGNMAMPAGQGNMGAMAMSNMGGMGMGCMSGGMGGMGGMGMGRMGGMGMGGMSGMGTGAMAPAGMGHTMDQGLTMREVVYIISMHDTLQVLQDVIQLQEKFLDGNSSDSKKDDFRQELLQIKEKTRKLASEYRAILSSQTNR